MILQSQEFQPMPLWENFLPGVQTPKVPVDDGVAPSSLDQTKNSVPTEVTGYGGGMY
jgi:hypothetical protein